MTEPVRDLPAHDRERWVLAVTVMSTIAAESGLNPWERPFRVRGRRWFAQKPSGELVPVSREAVEVAVRRRLNRHYRVDGKAQVQHIGVTARLVGAVIAAMSKVPGVALENEVAG